MCSNWKLLCDSIRFLATLTKNKIHRWCLILQAELLSVRAAISNIRPRLQQNSFSFNETLWIMHRDTKQKNETNNWLFHAHSVSMQITRKDQFSSQFTVHYLKEFITSATSFFICIAFCIVHQKNCSFCLIASIELIQLASGMQRFFSLLLCVYVFLHILNSTAPRSPLMFTLVFDRFYSLKRTFNFKSFIHTKCNGKQFHKLNFPL